MKRLFRSRRDRMIAGICGGLGEYFKVDATLIRLIFVVLAFASFGAMVFAYIISMLIIPLER